MRSRLCWAMRCTMLLVPLGAMVSGCASITAVQTIICRPSAPKATELRNYLVFVGTSSDSNAIWDRNNLGLPTVSPTKIALVSKASTCSAAGQAVNTDRGEVGTPRQMWVFTYGDRYVAMDPDIPHFDGAAVYAFTRQWALISKFGFYGYP